MNYSVAGAQSQKNYKDPAEYDMYSAASQDIAAGSFSKAIVDLDAWKRKYPDSEFTDTRELFYVKAYFETKQPSKALEAAAGLLAKDYKSTLDGPTDAINLLYMAAAAIQQVQNPSPEELATGAKPRTDWRPMTTTRSRGSHRGGLGQGSRPNAECVQGRTALYRSGSRRASHEDKRLPGCGVGS